MRLIDADALKSDVDSRVYHNHNGIIKIIDEQPTIKAVSSVHAHWIRKFLTQAGCYECSSCGRYSMLETNYCGSCGAKMDEKAEIEECPKGATKNG